MLGERRRVAAVAEFPISRPPRRSASGSQMSSVAPELHWSKVGMLWIGWYVFQRFEPRLGQPRVRLVEADQAGAPQMRFVIEATLRMLNIRLHAAQERAAERR